MDTMDIFLAITVLILCLYYLMSRKQTKLDLPGPKGDFLTGNALQLGSSPHQTISKWAKEFGDIIKINMFGKDVVVVNSYEGIMELLVTKSEIFGGRPSSFVFKYFWPHETVALGGINSKWSLMKKITMTGLKQVGGQLKELEDISMEVIDDLVTKFESYQGQVVDPRDDLTAAVSDITFLLVFGHRLPKDDHNELKEITRDVAYQVSADNRNIDIYPFLRNNLYHKFREMKRVKERGSKFFLRHLESTMKRFNDDEENCVLDGHIRESNKNPSGKDKNAITMGNVYALGDTLVQAGVITTATAVYALVSILANNPDIQSEAYAEITEIIGQRPPTPDDRFSIPYIESMIWELLRFMSHNPFAIPHMTSRDTTLLGHKIPKNTEVWPNLWHVHHDENLWEEPWVFNPKRFLDHEGNLLTADHPLRKQIFVFGAGRRVCAGEVMARNRMFLIIVVLLQRFKFLPPDGEKIDNDPRKYGFGLTLYPTDYKAKILACQ